MEDRKRPASQGFGAFGCFNQYVPGQVMSGLFTPTMTFDTSRTRSEGYWVSRITNYQIHTKEDAKTSVLHGIENAVLLQAYNLFKTSEKAYLGRSIVVCVTPGRRSGKD